MSPPARTAAAPGPDRHRAALHRRVAARVAGWGDDRASSWIAGHALLSMAGCGELSAGVRERLREGVRHATAHDLFVVARFQAVADALSAGADPVPLCPLKGIYLLDSVYRNDPGSRRLSDVDVLVPEGRIDQAVATLARELDLMEPPASRRLRRVSPARTLRGRAFELDLHHRLGYKHGAATAWDDLAPVPARVHERPVFALDRETTLVHLVTHLVKHRPLSRLAWVEDVLRWCERPLDGARAAAVAARLGARRSFAAGVRVLRRLVGDDFLPDLPPVEARGIALHERWLWRDLAAGALPDPAPAASWRTRSASLLSAALLADRPSDALRAVRGKAAETVLLAGRRGGDSR